MYYELQGRTIFKLTHHNYPEYLITPDEYFSYPIESINKHTGMADMTQAVKRTEEEYLAEQVRLNEQSNKS